MICHPGSHRQFVSLQMTVSSIGLSAARKMPFSYSRTWTVSRLGSGNGRCPSIQRNVKLYISQPDETPISYPYSIHGKTLSTTTSAKYLDVSISSDLSWQNHITNITKKANSTMSFIRRNTHSCSSKSKSKAYCTYVRPILEYASAAWSPHTELLTNKVEMVQRRAARFVKNDYSRTSSVSDMLVELKWQPLKSRRNIARVTILY